MAAKRYYVVSTYDYTDHKHPKGWLVLDRESPWVTHRYTRDGVPVALRPPFRRYQPVAGWAKKKEHAENRAKELNDAHENKNRE